MNEANDNRGQVGIGTLIIFIALVLVAAVAAGVLVNTAGLLQSKAEDTGSDAQGQVTNQIDVVSATGTVNSGKVDEIVLVVKKSPGSDPLNVSEASIQYTSGSDSKTLDSTDFTIQASDGSTPSDKVLSNTTERLKVKISLDGTGNNPSSLSEGSSATLRIVDQSGAQTIYGVNVPDVITDKDYVMV